MEKDLEDSDRRFRNIWENSLDGLRLIDKEGTIVLVNIAYCRMVAKERSDLIGQPFTAAYDERFRIHMHERVKERIEHGAVDSNLLRKVRLWNDDERWFELTNSPIEFSQKELYILSTIRDVTERTEREKKFQILTQAVEQNPAAILITDVAGNIVYVNHRFHKVSGYSMEDVLGKNPRILKSGEAKPDDYTELWTAILAGKEWRGVFHNKKKSGELYWELASISPVKDPEGRITHFVCVSEVVPEGLRKGPAYARHEH